jgi:hypothetical protein
MSGLIGGDVLSHYDVEIDLSGRRVRLWQASSCSASDLPWSGPRGTIPVHVTWGDRLIVTVTLNGKQVDSEVPVHGIAGSTIMVRLHRFGFMRIGNDQIEGPEIGVGDSQLISRR